MKAFIISLSKIAASAKSAQLMLDQLEKFGGLEVELFEGTYGNDAVSIFEKENRSLVQTSFKGHPVEKDSDYYYKSTRPGVMGCFHSHYRLWQKCLDLNEPILIFEDDVLLERGFVPVEWKEILLLATGKQKHQDEYYKKLLYTPTGNPEVFPLKHNVMPGAVGYGITQVAAKKLVDRYQVEFAPADNAINRSVVVLECHSHLMGRAAQDEEGKKSLTTSVKFWQKYNS